MTTFFSLGKYYTFIYWLNDVDFINSVRNYLCVSHANNSLKDCGISVSVRKYNVNALFCRHMFVINENKKKFQLFYYWTMVNFCVFSAALENGYRMGCAIHYVMLNWIFYIRQKMTYHPHCLIIAWKSRAVELILTITSLYGPHKYTLVVYQWINPSDLSSIIQTMEMAGTQLGYYFVWWNASIRLRQRVWWTLQLVYLFRLNGSNPQRLKLHKAHRCLW